MSSIAFGPVRRRMYHGETLVGEAVGTGGGWRLESEPGQPVVAGTHASLADLGTAAGLAKKAGGPTAAPWQDPPTDETKEEA